MQFDSSDADRRLRPPPNYQSRSVQIRLLTLVGLLFLVLISMQHAAKPSTWQWLWGTSPPTDAVQPNIEDSTRLGDHEVHFAPELLASVTDDTHFRKDESEAWFSILEQLRDTSDADLRANSLGLATRLQLSQQTNSYRGRVVDLRGTVKRAHQVVAAENDIGIENYWQCWMFLDNSPADPVVVYALEMPADFRGGMQIDHRAELSGIVFKRWAYQSAEDLTVAPVVLTNHIQLPVLTAKPPPRSAATSAFSMPLTILTVAATAVLTVVVLFYWSGRQSRQVVNRDDVVVLPNGDFETATDHSAGPSKP